MTRLGRRVASLILASFTASCASVPPVPQVPAKVEDPRIPGKIGLRTPPPQAYHAFLLAELALALGDSLSARAQYRLALTEDPDSPELRLRLAELALGEGDTLGALRLVEEARAEDPAFPRAHLLAARLNREKDPGRARALLRRVIALAPRMARSYLMLAPLERQRGGAGPEQAAYRALLRVHPDHLEGLLGLGRALVRDHRDAEAARVLTRACKAHPFAVEPWLGLARVRIVQGRSAEAVRVLYQGLEATEDDPSLAEELFRVSVVESKPEWARDLVTLLEGHESAATQTQVANLWDRLGDEPRAEKALLGARQQDPSFGPAIVELARLSRRRGDRAGARRSLLEVRPGGGAWAEAQRELAAQLEADGEEAAAEERLTRILVAEPRDAAAAESLAHLQARRARPELARETLERGRRARRLPGDDPGHRYALSLLLEESGEWKAVERLARKLLALDPDDAQVLNLLGYGLADRGIELERATELLHRAIRLDPLSPYFLDSLGWALYKRGRPQAALPLLHRAVLVDRRLCEAWHHLGEAFLAAGQPLAAQSAWAKALACAPAVTRVAMLRGLARALRGRARMSIEPWAPRARTRSFP